MARFFIDRPIFAWVIAILIMVAGGISITKLPISRYPNIVAWLGRVRAQPGFVPMAPYAAENVALIEQSRETA